MPDYRSLRLHTGAALLAGRLVRPVAALAAVAILAGLFAVALTVRGAGLLVAVFAWFAIGAAWRAAFARPGLPDEPSGAPVDQSTAPALVQLVAEEAAALGVQAPGTILLTAGRDAELHRRGQARVLTVGLALLAERRAAGVRVAVAEALAEDADEQGRRLVEVTSGPVNRALAVAEQHPIASLPWAWYATFAHRLLASAFRRRTVARDAALAARHGAEAATGHIRAWAREDRFDSYWAAFVVPCLRDGFRPPIAEGWRRVLASPEAMEEYAEQIAETPPERVAAVRAAGNDHRPPADEPSVLPEPLDALEARILEGLAGERRAALVPVTWERVAEAVLLPRVRADLEGQGWLAGATLADLADLARTEPGRINLLDEAMLLALADDGWTVTLDPGSGVVAGHGTSAVEPFGFTAALAEADSAAWREFTAEQGVADLPLLPLAGTPDAPPADDLEALAVAPPPASIELVLRGSRRLRLRALAVVIPALALALPLALVSLITSLDSAATPAVRWVMLGIGAGLALGVGVWSRARLRLAWTRGRVLLDAERLRIEHPGLLRRPYDVPRALVRGAVVDGEGRDRDASGRRVRFPVATTPWDDPGSRRAGIAGWLWCEFELPSVPLLGVGADAPNLALVFREPIAGPDVRYERRHGPMRGEGIGGLLLTVDVPAGIERSLAALGFAPRLEHEDIGVLAEAFSGPEATRA